MMLISCGSTKIQYVPTKEKINVSQEVLDECPESLPEPDFESCDTNQCIKAQILQNSDERANVYYECRGKHKVTAGAIRAHNKDSQNLDQPDSQQ